MPKTIELAAAARRYSSAVRRACLLRAYRRGDTQANENDKEKKHEHIKRA